MPRGQPLHRAMQRATHCSRPIHPFINSIHSHDDKHLDRHQCGAASRLTGAVGLSCLRGRERGESAAIMVSARLLNAESIE